jgi:hypothetical protein
MKTKRDTARSRTILMTAFILAACGQSGSSGSDGTQAGSSASATPPQAATSQVFTEVFDDAGASLGSVALTVACADPAVTHVRRALALLHNMTHVEAEEAFRMATEADPGCALGYWGQAASWVHPVWPDVPTDEQFARGWDLLESGTTLWRPTIGTASAGASPIGWRTTRLHGKARPRSTRTTSKPACSRH